MSHRCNLKSHSPSTVHKLYAVLFALFTAFLASSCSTVSTSPPAQAETTWTSPTHGRSIAFGKFDLLDNGKPDKVGLFEDAYFVILADQSGEVIKVPLTSQGWFFINLAPDAYTLLRLHRTSFDGTRREWSINKIFSVTSGDKGLYIGNIRFETGKGIPVRAVEDAEQAAIDEFHKQYPGFSFEPTKRLLQPEPKLGTFNSVIPICSNQGMQWGVTCTREIQGVEPIAPELKRRLNGSIDFNSIDTTKPTFSWKPVPDNSLSYDFVIWQAVAYPIPLGGSQYFPGKVVVYEENLKQPSIALKNSLKPKTKYYWSARLRKEVAVSTWSTAGHFVFLLFAGSWGSGELFAFETP